MCLPARGAEAVKKTCCSSAWTRGHELQIHGREINDIGRVKYPVTEVIWDGIVEFHHVVLRAMSSDSWGLQPHKFLTREEEASSCSECWRRECVMSHLARP